jgi:hypothetical protein
MFQFQILILFLMMLHQENRFHTEMIKFASKLAFADDEPKISLTTLLFKLFSSLIQAKKLFRILSLIQTLKNLLES